MDQAHQGHLEIDPGVRCVPHPDLGPAEILHGPHQGGQADPAGLGGERVALGPGHGDQFGGDQGEEPLAQVVDQVDRELLRAEARGGQVGHGHQRPLDVPLGQGLHHLVEFGQVVVDGVGGRHLVEDRQGVAGRAAAAADGEVEGVVADVEVGVGADLGEQLGQGVGAEQAELEVLGPAADGRQDLLGVGRGQHEDDVGRRLLQGLEQRVGRGRREHVDLVDDVDLLAARRAEGGPGHQVAHGVDPVVGRGVELVDVERRAPGDLDARGADPARLAVVQVGAVEGLGQDAGRRGLAGAPGAAEQVGVGHPAVADGVAQGEHDVVLAAYLGERRRTEAPVQGLVGDFLGRVGHAGSLPVGSGRDLGPTTRRR